MRKGILIGVGSTLAALAAGIGVLIFWVKDDLDPSYHDHHYPNS